MQVVQMTGISVVLLYQSNKFKINSTQVVMILMCMLTTVVCCMQKHYKPNFSRLSANCWQKVDSPSVTQGIYDAMRDLQKGKERGENDAYISQGSEMLLKACTGQ